MKVTGVSGLIATLDGSSPNLAERRGPFVPIHGNSQPGFYPFGEPGHLSARRASSRAGICLPLRHSSHLRTRRADVLFRSGPEINS